MFAGFCEVNCSVCCTILIRRSGWVIENAKLGLESYCSPECFSKGRMRRVQCTCDNPACKKSFSRVQSAIEKHNFCSHHCSATFLNPFNKKAKPPHIPKPRPPSKYTKEVIIQAIRDFVSKNERIPLKRELNAEFCAAKKLFGTWNIAIKSAGFRSNRTLFSRRYNAKDGHMCDSYAEGIIDDWLSERHIAHRIHVPYFHRNMSADFAVGNILIEFFGLYGDGGIYDAHVAEKKKLWKLRNLFVIDIYPQDLFPVNNLTDIFRGLV